jgi:ABC-2 type transport system ATP-binding protein
MNALRVRGVSHAFGARPVLREVSFDLAEGQFAALTGRNGAGKTTLISLISGLYLARHGSIEVFGAEVAVSPVAALSRMGLVFQRTTLDLDLSVAENLRYFGALHDMPAAACRARGEEELERLGVVHKIRQKVRDLSGGERRRVELARALLPRPRLILLDEPTAGLDPPARQGLVEHARALCRERGVSVLWATHLLDEIAPGDLIVSLEAPRDGATAA